MSFTESLTVRIFLSSTFRDFGEERDLLVRKVFPKLRARLRDRFVELVDVDLRWGITAEQAERGEVLPICLAEIDRARPYFIGMLGERYGWIPPADKFPCELLDSHGWLREHLGGKSVTEFEILHGVLNNPAMAGRAFFYFRSSEYASAKGGDYLAASPVDSERQRELKERIQSTGFPVFDVANPENLATHLEQRLWDELDARYPADLVPDLFEKENIRHQAFALPKRRLYLGGAGYFQMLGELLGAGKQRIVIEGDSGAGKSALLANWAFWHRECHPSDLVHEYYLDASGDSGDPVQLAARWIETISRLTGSSLKQSLDTAEVFEHLSHSMAEASSYAEKHQLRWVFILDSLNSLTDLGDLRWFPEFLPPRIHLVVSCLAGDVRDALDLRGCWSGLDVKPLTAEQSRELLVNFLGRYNKNLPTALVRKLLVHHLSSNPLFLRTLAEELRLFGVHEELEGRLDECLRSKTIDDLFERVLQRVEGDCGHVVVIGVMESIWASRSGLTEEEILRINGIVPADWAAIRYALDEALLESAGRITFAHDHIRVAVRDRYLRDSTRQVAVHRRLGEWFSLLSPNARRAEEEPWQWRSAKDWVRLKESLLDREMFQLVFYERSDGELLGYWLELETLEETDFQNDIHKAWARWFDGTNNRENLELCLCLVDFLAHSARLGEFTQNLALLAVNLAESVYGIDHLETADALATLGKIYEELGDFGHAMDCSERALNIRRIVFGPCAEETASSINQMARLHQSNGDLESARALSAEALAIAEAALGAKDTRLASALCGYGSILVSLGEYGESESYLRRALKVNEDSVGLSHPDTSATMSSLAVLLHNLGRWEEALLLNTNALESRKKSLGEFHPRTAESINNIALIYQARGDMENAWPMLELALKINRKVFGESHPVVALALNNLALLLHMKNLAADAEHCYRQALEIQIVFFGQDHPDSALTMSNLACLLEERGNFAEAEILHRSSLEIREKILGDEHPDTGNGLSNLAEFLVCRGSLKEAIDLHSRALQVRKLVLGDDHPHTFYSMNNLGMALDDDGEHGKAIGHLEEAAFGLFRHFGPQYFQTKDVYNNALEVCRKITEPEKAISSLKSLLALGEKLYGRGSLDFCKVLYCVGNALVEHGDISGARELLEEEIQLAGKLEGPDSKSCISSIENLRKIIRKANLN